MSDVQISRLDEIAAILDELTTSMSDVFGQIEWLESEIAQAQSRWPDRSDELWHAFSLLRPPEGMPNTECVYRAYARELLDRVGNDEDLRSGTAVEVCLGLRGASLRAPLSHEGFGLYVRMWQVSGLPALSGINDTGEHYEAISASAIDEAEAHARRVCAQPERVLRVTGCSGQHHGQIVNCTFSASEVDAAPSQQATVSGADG